MCKCCTFHKPPVRSTFAQEQSSRFNGALAHPANVQTAQDLSKKDLNGLVFCCFQFFSFFFLE